MQYLSVPLSPPPFHFYIHYPVSIGPMQAARSSNEMMFGQWTHQGKILSASFVLDYLMTAIGMKIAV